MEANIQDVIASLSRQIADISTRLAFAEAVIKSYENKANVEEEAS